MTDSIRSARALLGLADSASLDDARAAFRRLAKRCHPDAPGGDAKAFLALNAALKTLSSASKPKVSKRRQSLVSRFWKATKMPPKTPRAGADMQAVLRLSLEDAVCGAVRRVSLAGGRALDVRCPPGCGPGDIIRLRGAGAAGRHGGAPGDVLVRIAVLHHERAMLRGRDLHVRHWLELSRLRSGGQTQVRTPRGPLKVRIPPLSHHGQVLRLKGQGLPACGAHKAGHLYITLKARRGESFAGALGRFARIWTNPLRPVT